MTIAESWHESPEGWERQRWVRLGNETDGDMLVVPRCPKCGRFTKCGTAIYRWESGFAFEGFTCARHGDIQPFWVWDEC